MSDTKEIDYEKLEKAIQKFCKKFNEILDIISNAIQFYIQKLLEKYGFKTSTKYKLAKVYSEVCRINELNAWNQLRTCRNLFHLVRKNI